MPHFIIFEISRALNNNFQADCSDLFIGLSIPSYEEFCIVLRICMGYNGKVRTIFVRAENYTFAA